MFMIQVVTHENGLFKRFNNSQKNKRYKINVTMKYLYSFVVSVTTYYVFQSMSMALP